VGVRTTARSAGVAKLLLAHCSPKAASVLLVLPVGGGRGQWCGMGGGCVALARPPRSPAQLRCVGLHLHSGTLAAAAATAAKLPTKPIELHYYRPAVAGPLPWAPGPGGLPLLGDRRHPLTSGPASWRRLTAGWAWAPLLLLAGGSPGAPLGGRHCCTLRAVWQWPGLCGAPRSCREPNSTIRHRSTPPPCLCCFRASSPGSFTAPVGCTSVARLSHNPGVPLHGPAAAALY